MTRASEEGNSILRRTGSLCFTSFFFMNLARCLFALMLPGLLLLVSCRTPAEAPGATAAADGYQQDPDERDAVLAALETLKQDALRRAFAGLSRYGYTRYTRTEQRDAAQQRTAFSEHITRIDRRNGQRRQTTLQADSSGVFDIGALGGFITANPDQRDAESLPEYVLTDDPPYLAPRNRDAFLYRFLPDTSFWNAPTQVIEVRAHPINGTGQALRRTRFYLDRASGELIAIYFERTEDALFFDEESRFYLRLRPTLDGSWVPFNVRFQTRLHLPLRAPRHLATVSTYYAYESAG